MPNKFYNQDKSMKIADLKTFEEVAQNNGYEVFTPNEIAEFSRVQMIKSVNGQMNDNEKLEFVLDMHSLQKAVVLNEKGEEEVRYYRKKQVDFQKSVEKDGIVKSLSGVYTDTPENRRLGRVGLAYEPSDDEVVKSLVDIVKAQKTGYYVRNAENRRLHRVGMPYKKKEGGNVGNGGGDDNGKDDKLAGSDKKLMNMAKESFETPDDDDTWFGVIEDHFGEKAVDECLNEDGEADGNKAAKYIAKLPKDVVARTIQEVNGSANGDGTKDGGDTTAGIKNEDLKRSFRTIDDDDTWSSLVAEHFGEKAAKECEGKGGVDADKMLSYVKKLPAKEIQRAYKEVGNNPEE